MVLFFALHGNQTFKPRIKMDNVHWTLIKDFKFWFKRDQQHLCKNFVVFVTKIKPMYKKAKDSMVCIHRVAVPPKWLSNIWSQKAWKSHKWLQRRRRALLVGWVASCPSSRPVTCTSQEFDVFLQDIKAEPDLHLCRNVAQVLGRQVDLNQAAGGLKVCERARWEGKLLA